METPETIASEGIPDPDKPTLKGGGKQVVKLGEMKVVNDDFDRLAPKKVENRPRGVRIGTLADGRTVIARPSSEPTLEIQSGGKPVFKLRYKP